jgi:hypothetical protein
METNNKRNDSFIDPIVLVYSDGFTQLKELSNPKLRGAKLNGRRPVLILYPEGLVDQALIDQFYFTFDPKYGQAVSYKPMGTPYKLS